MASKISIHCKIKKPQRQTLLRCHFIVLVRTQAEEGRNINLENFYDIVSYKQMLVKARSRLYDQSDLKNVKEVVREQFRSFHWRDGGKYEVNPVGKGDISHWNYRNGAIEGKRRPKKTSSHAELEFYLVSLN